MLWPGTRKVGVASGGKRRHDTTGQGEATRWERRRGPAGRGGSVGEDGGGGGGRLEDGMSSAWMAGEGGDRWHGLVGRGGAARFGKAVPHLVGGSAGVVAPPFAPSLLSICLVLRSVATIHERQS